MKAGATILMSIPALLLAVFIPMAAAAPLMYGGAQLEAAAAPVAAVDAGGQWRISISIVNRGDSAARDVRVAEVSTDSAPAVSSLPLRMGEIPPGGMRIGSLRFHGAGRLPDKGFVINVKGTYLDLEGRHRFSLRYTVSNGIRPPDEPPGFAAANAGPGRAVPEGPVHPGPKGNETSTPPASPSAAAKAHANVPIDRSAGRDLVPVQVNGLWGYANSHSPQALAIRPRFTHALQFSEGLAAVAIANKWGYIDASGAFRIPAQFQAAAPFSGGVARVTSAGGKQVRYIDTTGAFVPGPAR